MDAVLVFEAARFVHVQIAGAGGGTKQTFAKPRAFFIRPVHQAHGDRRLAMILRVEAAQNFHARQHIQAAVEPAAVGHGIHVAADEQSAFRIRRAGWSRGCRRRRCGFPRAGVSSFCRSHARVLTQIGVKATRCAPLASPVSARSSFSSATVRFGFSAEFIFCRDQRRFLLEKNYCGICRQSELKMKIGCKERTSMPTLATTVDGLKLPNPFIIGSGPPGTNLNVIAQGLQGRLGRGHRQDGQPRRLEGHQRHAALRQIDGRTTARKSSAGKTSS